MAQLGRLIVAPAPSAGSLQFQCVTAYTRVAAKDPSAIPVTSQSDGVGFGPPRPCRTRARRT